MRATLSVLAAAFLLISTTGATYATGFGHGFGGPGFGGHGFGGDDWGHDRGHVCKIIVIYVPKWHFYPASFPGHGHGFGWKKHPGLYKVVKKIYCHRPFSP